MEAEYDFETKFRDQILQCSRCGFCQAHCPVFGATLRPSYNARGKMLILKEVIDKKLDLRNEMIETLFQCTDCAGCSKSCPSGVNVPEIIKQVRKDMVNIGICHPAFEALNKVLKKHTNIYAEAERKEFNKKKIGRAQYVYFVGCVGYYRESEATLASLKLLDRLCVDYTLIDEVCCSGPLEDVGYPINEDLVQKNMGLILSTGAQKVITNCPYCFRTLRDQPQYAALKERGIETIHITQFLKEFDLSVKTSKKVTYHDSCDLGRHCGIYEEPRDTIRKIAKNFVEMRHHHSEALCCGAGGGVRGAFPKNSIAMARRRLMEAEEVGAEVVLTDCNSCRHNFSNAKLRRHNFKIYTTAQFINELLEAG